MNDKLKSRLDNWKFESAKAYLKGEPDGTRTVVNALARTFGDVGWFAGDLGIIVDSAILSLSQKEPSDSVKR